MVSIEELSVKKTNLLRKLHNLEGAILFIDELIKEKNAKILREKKEKKEAKEKEKEE